MKKVKITVLKTTFDAELAAEYGIEGLKPCPMLKPGQVFHADYAKPEGLCDEAWKAIYQYVFALAHGAEGGLFYIWGLDSQARRGDCQLQRRAAPGDLQVESHRHRVGAPCRRGVARCFLRGGVGRKDVARCFLRGGIGGKGVARCFLRGGVGRKGCRPSPPVRR